MEKIKKYIIKGAEPLKGDVQIEGAKNAMLPIMASTILLKEKVVLENVPFVEDIKTMQDVLENLGIKIKRNKSSLEIIPEKITNFSAPYEAVRKMRASIYCLGPLLVRLGKAKVALPGGCSFGPRPINFHIQALLKMGANIKIEHGYIIASAKKLKGAEIYFDKKSVGATAHIIMSAVLSKGKTVILNAAKEPEVIDLINFLKKCGADIKGEGGDIIEIKGVKELHSPLKYSIISDRIEAGTFLVAGAITKGELTVKGEFRGIVDNVIEKLKEAGCEVNESKGSIQIKREDKIKPLKIEASPYPGFPTDMQPQFTALLSLANGTSIVKDEIYPERFGYTAELIRMGAKINVENGICVIDGVRFLQGTHVVAPDIRAGASLVLAACAAKGESIIDGVAHIERGYKNFDKKLKKLGAKIKVEN